MPTEEESLRLLWGARGLRQSQDGWHLMTELVWTLGTFFKFGSGGRHLTNASCDRKFGTRVHFFLRLRRSGLVPGWNLRVRRIELAHAEHTNSSPFWPEVWHPGTKAKSRSAGGISCLAPGYSFRGRSAVKKGTRVMYQFLRRSSTDVTRPPTRCTSLCERDNLGINPPISLSEPEPIGSSRDSLGIMW